MEPFLSRVSSPFSIIRTAKTSIETDATQNQKIWGEIPEIAMSWEAAFPMHPEIRRFDYSAGFKRSFIASIMELPTELRYIIYEFVAFSWTPGEEYPRTCTYTGWNAPSLEVVSFARRNSARSRSRFPIATPNRTRSNHRVCLEGETKPEFIKVSEFENIRALDRAFAEFEQGKYVQEDVDQNRFDNKALGISNDFRKWFWTTTILGLKTHIRPKDSWLTVMWLSMISQQTAESIQQISIYLNSFRCLGCIENPQCRSRNILGKPFEALCNQIARKLNGLKTIMLWLDLSHDLIHPVTDAHHKENWTHATRGLKVESADRFDNPFDIKLCLNFRHYDRDPLKPALNNAAKEMEIERGRTKLKALMMPDCLNKVDDMRLGSLFNDAEDNEEGDGNMEQEDSQQLVLNG